MSDAVDRLTEIELAYRAASGGVYDDCRWLVAQVRTLRAEKAARLPRGEGLARELTALVVIVVVAPFVRVWCWCADRFRGTR